MGFKNNTQAFTACEPKSSKELVPETEEGKDRTRSLHSLEIQGDT